MQNKQSVQDGIDSIIDSRRTLARQDYTVLELETEMMAMDLRDEMLKRMVETNEGKLIASMFPEMNVTWYEAGRVGFTLEDGAVKGSIQVTDRGRVVLDRMSARLDSMLERLDAVPSPRRVGPALASIKLKAPV